MKTVTTEGAIVVLKWRRFVSIGSFAEGKPHTSTERGWFSPTFEFHSLFGDQEAADSEPSCDLVILQGPLPNQL